MLQATAPALPRVIVIGGGMAGLAAAEAVAGDRGEQAVQVVLLEAAGRCGGVLGTTRRDDGWIVERSADCFLAARAEGVALAERLGITRELVGVDPRVRRALVWHRGRTVPVPRGFRLLAPGRLDGILASPLLSPAGKLRIIAERWVQPRRGAAEESLRQFTIRRLGREAFERLVQPLAAGIWTADPAALGMAAACPEFLAMERDRGSLWAGEQARLRASPAGGDAEGARYGQFVTFARGMETLPRRLADHLVDRGVEVITGRAEQLSRSGGRWSIAVAGAVANRPPDVLLADGVVVATPAAAAAALLAGIDQGLAADLAGIPYAGSAIVSLGYRREAVAHPLDAAGLVVPTTAGRRGLAISFSSSKFPGRAPAGCVLLRVFLGGALDPGVLELDDDALADLARREARVLVGAAGDPLLVQVDRWGGAMPQYHVGHAERVARIESALDRHPGLALAGAAYRGVGIPQVIASGQAAGRRIREHWTDAKAVTPPAT